MAIAVTHLTSGEDGDGGNTSTASITPTANALVLLAVSSGDTAAATAPSGVTGCNLTWVKIADVNEDEVGTGDINMSLWRAQGASPTTGTLSITWADAPQNSIWTVVEYTGVPVGNNGADAIEQFVTEGLFASETANSAAFSVAPSNTSAIFAAFGKNSTSAVPTAGSGYTAIGTANDDGTPSNKIFCQHALPSTPAGLAIDASSPAAVFVNNSTNGVVTTGSFTPPAGSRLWAFASISRGGTGATVTFTSSPALTWTTVEEQSTGNGVVAIGYANVSVSQAYTVTATATGSTNDQGRSIKVQVITGGESPGGVPRGVTGGETETGTVCDIVLNTTRDDSMLFAVMNDWNGNGDWAPGANQTEIYHHTASGLYDGVLWRRDGVVNIGSYTLSETSTGGQSGNVAGVEIRRAFEPADNTVTCHWDNSSATTMVAVEILEFTATTHQAAATLSGTGALTASARWTANAAAALSGAGTLAAAGVRSTFGAAALAGAGSLAAAGVREHQAAAALSGTGALTASAVSVINAAASLSGLGSLIADAPGFWSKFLPPAIAGWDPDAVAAPSGWDVEEIDPPSGWS